MTQETLVKMYNTLILPYFIYCSNAWLDGTTTNINKLYKLQKRAARVITGVSYEIRSSEIFKNLNWKPIETNLKKRELLLTFKAIRGWAPKYITDYFTILQNNVYGLRSNDKKLYLPKPNTNFLKSTFIYRASKLWNSLPDDIIENIYALSLNSFINIIDKYLYKLY